LIIMAVQEVPELVAEQAVPVEPVRTDTGRCNSLQVIQGSDIFGG